MTTARLRQDGLEIRVLLAMNDIQLDSFVNQLLPELRLKRKVALCFGGIGGCGLLVDGRKLLEIADQNDLHSTEATCIAADTLCHGIQLLQKFRCKHTDLVNDQSICKKPAAFGLEVLVDILDKCVG